MKVLRPQMLHKDSAISEFEFLRCQMLHKDREISYLEVWGHQMLHRDIKPINRTSGDPKYHTQTINSAHWNVFSHSVRVWCIQWVHQLSEFDIGMYCPTVPVLQLLTALRLCSNTALRTMDLLNFNPHEDTSMHQQLPKPRSPSHAPALTTSGIALRVQYSSWPWQDVDNYSMDGWWVGLACVALHCIYMVPGQPQQINAKP